MLSEEYVTKWNIVIKVNKPSITDVGFVAKKIHKWLPHQSAFSRRE